jgi:hypothetical protein
MLKQLDDFTHAQRFAILYTILSFVSGRTRVPRELVGFLRKRARDSGTTFGNILFISSQCQTIIGSNVVSESVFLKLPKLTQVFSPKGPMNGHV